MHWTIFEIFKGGFHLSVKMHGLNLSKKGTINVHLKKSTGQILFK